MTIDMMSSENSSLTTSPRISFSHDLFQTDEASSTEGRQDRLDSTLLDRDSDGFDFCISNILQVETTSAEELFSGGLIRPVQIQEKFVNTSRKLVSVPKAQLKVPSLPPLPLVHSIKRGSKQDNWKETILGNTDSEQKNQAKSFWNIKRSSSLHCENSHKKSSFWPPPILSRSNSTGSAPKPKQGLRENQKQKKNLMGVPASATNATFYVYPLSQKSTIRKNYLGSNGNGVMINPVLHMPVLSSNISKGTAKVLGLGSLFRNGRDKKIKK